MVPEMTTGSLFLDVIVGIAGFVFTLWALITGIFWLIAIFPSGRRFFIWRTMHYGTNQESSGARERANYARERANYARERGRILTRHGWVDPAIYYAWRYGREDWTGGPP